MNAKLALWVERASGIFGVVVQLLEFFRNSICVLKRMFFEQIFQTKQVSEEIYFVKYFLRLLSKVKDNGEFLQSDCKIKKGEIYTYLAFVVC